MIIIGYNLYKKTKLVYLYKFNTVSHFFQCIFITTIVVNAKAEKHPFTRRLTQMIFNHLLQRQGKYGMYNLTEIPIVKSPIS